MLEPSAGAETVTPPNASPLADLIVPDSTASAAHDVIGLSAVADMAAPNTGPRPNIAKFLVFLMAFLLMRRRRAASWSYRVEYTGTLPGGGRRRLRRNR